MQVLVLSDSHGHTFRLRRVLEQEADCEVVFFLGDGVSDLMKVRPQLPERSYVIVRGNNDWESDYDDFAYRYIEGHTIIATHGHRVAVRVTRRDLAAKAQQVRADIALYGHTHVPGSETSGGVLLVNPGALCDGSYAVLTLTKERADVSFRHCPI